MREGFPDRGYLSDGRLAPRDVPEALVHDPEQAGARACSLVLDGGIVAVDGSWTPVAVDTLCVHGDTTDADRRARSVRDALESARVVLQSFTADTSKRADG